jgi:hypothetical protein
VNTQPDPENDFDLDATEQELLDEFGLLVAAEYYYKTSTTQAPLAPQAQPGLTPPPKQPSGPSLDQRVTDALQRQQDLLKD